MRALQDERLVKTVRRVYADVAYYRNVMDANGVSPDDVKSVDDLHKLPFITKDALREGYPYGLLAAPLSDVVRVHSTSGTTGRRIIAFYTQDDVDLWEECCARAIVAAGGSRDDVVQVSYGYGLFTGGAGLDGGSRKVGALTLPMSSGNTERQIQFMADLGSTILCCTPSYAAFLAETINSRGMRGIIKLKAGIFGAEAWSEAMRVELEKNLGIKAYDIYGLTEITGPGVSFECEEQTGLHVNEDHFIPEIIDPSTGKVLPRGEKGELVLTSISKRAFPLIRYRTRDVCVLMDDACPCGRTLVKMSRLMGRTDDMLTIRGINVFPSQIETVLLKSGMTPNYQIIVDRVNHTDTLEVHVEMTPEMFSDTVKDISKMEGELVAEMKSMLSISPKVTLMAPRSITRSEGKAVRVIDKRII
jgi:phenylacetate-CoA ligase